MDYKRKSEIDSFVERFQTLKVMWAKDMYEEVEKGMRELAEDIQTLDKSNHS